ncbi:MAG: hypothetical protein ACRELY_25590 [Polyangiaceae bacterium]
MDTSATSASLVNLSTCGTFDVAVNLKVASPTPVVVTLDVRQLDCGGSGSFRLGGLETESCVCIGSGCAPSGPPYADCTHALDGTIVISTMGTSCGAGACTQDFVADIAIDESGGNVSGTVHVEDHMTYSTDKTCGQTL